MANKKTDFLSEWEDAVVGNKQNNEIKAPTKKKRIDKETIPSHTIQNAQNNENTTTKEETNNNENTLNLSPTEKKWLKIGAMIIAWLFILDSCSQMFRSMFYSTSSDYSSSDPKVSMEHKPYYDSVIFSFHNKEDSAVSVYVDFFCFNKNGQQVDWNNLSEHIAPNAKMDISVANIFSCPQHLGYTYKVGELKAYWK